MDGQFRNAKWLSAIDLMRGLAALAVVLHHANGAFWRSHGGFFEGGVLHFLRTRPLGEVLLQPIAGFGFLGVPLFFVISGFCIHIPYAGNTSPLDVRSFALRRFFRLYPLYLVVCVVVFAMMQFTSGPAKRSATLSNFLGHLVFWHYNVEIPELALGISPVLWSVAVEVHFYLLYALLLPFIRRFGFERATLLALIVDVAYRVWWSSLGPLPGGALHAGIHPFFTPYHFAPARFGEWLLGACIAERFARDGLRHVVRPYAAWVIAAGALLVGSIAMVAGIGCDRYWLDVPSTIAFAMLLAAMVAREQRFGPPAMSAFWRMAKWLGDRSYSLYLVHFTVILAGVEVYARIKGCRTSEEKDQLGGSPQLLLVVALSFVLTFVVTDLTYRFVELPTHRLGRRFGNRRGSAPAEVSVPNRESTSNASS